MPYGKHRQVKTRTDCITQFFLVQNQLSSIKHQHRHDCQNLEKQTIAVMHFVLRRAVWCSAALHTKESNSNKAKL